jgi:DNA-binding response OmpR family regulator
LVVDDARASAEATRLVLEAAGHVVRWVTTVEDALAAAHTWSPETAIVDRWLPDGDGLELARVLRASTSPRPRIVVLSGDRTPVRPVGGVDVWLRKPTSRAALLASVAES